MPRNKNRPTLDELFRKKAEEHEIPFREEDWQAMQKSLDARDLQRARVRRVRWMVAASLLAVSLMGYFLVRNQLQINELSRQVAQMAEPIQPHEPLLPVPDLPERPQPSVRDEERVVSFESNVGDREDPAGFSPTTDNPTEATIDGQDPSIQSDPSIAGFLRPEAPTPVALAANRQIPPPVQPVHSVETAKTDRTGPGESGIFGRDPSEWNRSARALSVGLVLAPDLSMAGEMPGFNSPGLKAGVTLDLELGAGLSLQTGVIYSGVRYSGNGELYTPSGYTYGSNGAPDHLHAVCHLLDIPVSLRMHLHETDHFRIVAGAGISSYIMLNERYRFDYAQPLSGQLREWEGATGTRHWASHASLSIGYEIDLSPGWSLRAEPYLRLPVRNVGHANVKLYSVGSLFSLNVNL